MNSTRKFMTINSIFFFTFVFFFFSILHTPFTFFLSLLRKANGMFGNRVTSEFYSGVFSKPENPYSTRVKYRIEFLFYSSTRIPTPLLLQGKCGTHPHVRDCCTVVVLVLYKNQIPYLKTSVEYKLTMGPTFSDFLILWYKIFSGNQRLKPKFVLCLIRNNCLVNMSI
jgi:hypothetical protein